MKKKIDNSQNTDLRRQAEAKLSERKKKAAALPATESDTQRLVHELEVHQIELEMQNEELVQSRVQVETGLRQYTDLYDFAPVGYFTLARDGAIHKINLAGADMLGVERGATIKRRFGVFVSVESRSVFNSFIEKVFGSKQKETCEVALQKNGTVLHWMHIEAITEDGQECRAVVVDITERKRAEVTLRESELRIRTFLDSTSDMAFLKDESFRHIIANRALCKFYGKTESEIIGKTDFDLMFEKAAAECRKTDKQMLLSNSLLITEEVVGDRYYETMKFPVTLADGKKGIGAYIRDITERKRAEAEILKLNRTYALLSNINQLIVRERNKQRLFEGACKIAIDDGKFLMSWIGMLDEVTGRVETVASAGVIDGYLKHLHIKISDIPEGRGPTGMALREGRTVICGDIENDERMIPWRKQALTLGYKSSAAFPLMIDSKTTGTINFYSSEVHFFDKGEIHLLEELAVDISYALETLKQEEQRKRLEEALQESENEFHSLAEAMPQIVWITRADGWNIYFNQQWVDYTGLTLEESYGHGWNKPFHPDDQQRAWDAWQNATKYCAAYSLECRLRRADGVYTWWLIRGIPLLDAHGTVLKWFGTCTDINEIKQAEEELKKSEEKYRYMFANNPQPMWIYDLETLAFLEINDAAIHHYGYTKEEFLLMTLKDIRPKEDIDALLKDVELTREVYNLAGVWRHLKKDGEIINVEIVSHSIIFKDRKARHVMVNDITERKRAEKSLQESEEKYRSIFENVQDVYYETLLDGTILEVSPSIKFISKGQYKRTDLIGKSMYEFYPDSEDRDTLIAVMKDKGSVNDFEVILKNRDGSLIHCSISATIKLDAQGRPEKIIGSIHNITERKRAEERIKILSNAVESAYDSFMLTDMNGNVTYANESAIKAFGNLPEDVKKMNIAQFDVHPENVVKIVEEMKTKGSWSGETTCIRKKKETFPVLLSTSFIKNDRGNPVGMMGVFRDITERKQAEEALAIEQFRMNMLMDNVPDYIYFKDKESRFIRINKSQVTRFGLNDPAEVVGKTDFDFFTEQHARQAFEDEQKTIITGQPLIGVEEKETWPDGTVTWVTTTKMPLRDKEGEIIGTFGISKDITMRKLAEEALQESEKRMSDIIYSVGDWVWEVDENGRYTYSSKKGQDFFGYALEDIIGKTPFDFMPPDEAQRVKIIFSEIVSNRAPIKDLENWNIRKDGKRICLLTNGVPILDENGDLKGYRGVDKDITGRKVLEEQLRQIQKLESLGTLAGGIAHDFNNILGIILAYTTTIERMKNDPEKLERAVDTISKAVQRGTTIVRQILTFARKSDVEFSLININDVAKEVIGMILETFPRTLTYSQNLQKGIPAINGDHSQIHQALLNLCVNARDAMPDGGVLTINTSNVDGITLHDQYPDALASPYICVEVSDTGMGMTEEVRNRIFEPFYTTKEKGKGTGLGLAVVFGVVKTHLGFVEVESELGKGTIFRLYFPVLPVTIPAQEEIQEIVKDIPGGTETLLVVEDEETLMVFLQISLAAKGYTVISAVDGPEAVKTYRERHKEISMVFTDLGLPGMTGMEEINIIKRINPDVKIIVATGYLDPKMKTELLKAGIKKFILKPYNFEEILKLVRDVLDEK